MKLNNLLLEIKNIESLFCQVLAIASTRVIERERIKNGDKKW